MLDEIWEEIKPAAMDFLAALAGEVDLQMQGRAYFGIPTEFEDPETGRKLVMPVRRVGGFVNVNLSMAPVTMPRKGGVNLFLTMTAAHFKPTGMDYPLLLTYDQPNVEDLLKAFEWWNQAIPKKAQEIAREIRWARKPGGREWFPKPPKNS